MRENLMIMNNNENTNENLNEEQKLFHNAGITDRTAVIVRNERAAKRLARLYSHQILKNNIRIITADEIAECIYLPDFADSPQKMIAEDKRVFAFYQTVLNDPKKQWMEYLNITGCFNAVHIAGQFYALWNEINENMLDTEKVKNIISGQQLATWNTFCEIYQALHLFLCQLGLTDKIYTRTKSAVDTNIDNIRTMMSSYNRIVFLDCWGDTPLMGYMLRRVSEHFCKFGNKPEIILTVPAFR